MFSLCVTVQKWHGFTAAGCGWSVHSDHSDHRAEGTVRQSPYLPALPSSLLWQLWKWASVCLPLLFLYFLRFFCVCVCFFLGGGGGGGVGYSRLKLKPSFSYPVQQNLMRIENLYFTNSQWSLLLFLENSTLVVSLFNVFFCCHSRYLIMMYKYQKCWNAWAIFILID